MMILSWRVFYHLYIYIFFFSVLADEPGPPGRPEATDWDKDHVDLRWTPPLNDGGSPITGYVIEKREKGTPRWIKACETSGPECKGRADNLDEGVEYEFRVKAINAAGPGEPSDVSKPITAKSRRSKLHHSVRYPNFIKSFSQKALSFILSISLQWHQRSTGETYATSPYVRTKGSTSTLKFWANLRQTSPGSLTTRAYNKLHIAEYKMYLTIPSSLMTSPSVKILAYIRSRLLINMDLIRRKLK